MTTIFNLTLKIPFITQQHAQKVRQRFNLMVHTHISSVLFKSHEIGGKPPTGLGSRLRSLRSRDVGSAAWVAVVGSWKNPISRLDM